MKQRKTGNPHWNLIIILLPKTNKLSCLALSFFLPLHITSVIQVLNHSPHYHSSSVQSPHQSKIILQFHHLIICSFQSLKSQLAWAMKEELALPRLYSRSSLLSLLFIASSIPLLDQLQTKSVWKSPSMLS